MSAMYLSFQREIKKNLVDYSVQIILWKFAVIVAHQSVPCQQCCMLSFPKCDKNLLLVVDICIS